MSEVSVHQAFYEVGASMESRVARERCLKVDRVGCADQ